MMLAYRVIVLLMSIVLLSQSSSASIGSPVELLSKASDVQISPEDTWSCCSVSQPCEQSEPPSCAFDGDSSTRLTFAPGQRVATITVELDPGAIIDHFQVSFDASSVIPSSVAMTLRGNDVTWTTYNNKSCQPTDRHLRKQGSLYYSCTPAGQFWNASVPEGVFSVRNGSSGWLWWRNFSQLQLTIEANDADYGNHPENSSIVISDIRLYGWNLPTNGCNCHPVGVANATAPCDSSGICRCRLGSTPGQCVPIFSDQMVEGYGPKSGGTGFTLTLNYTQNISNVTIGNDYKCLLLNISDGAIHVQTTEAKDSDLQSPLPIWICWERTRDAVSCLATNVEFTYKPVPVVYSIYPRRSIVRGGITQTVIGANLDSVMFPYITVYSVLESTKQDQVIEYNYLKGVYQNHPEDQRCKTVNSTMLECQAMPFKEKIGSDHSLYIGISLDIIQLYNDYQHCLLDKCDFAQVDDPVIISWPDDLMAFPVYDGRKTVTISGQWFQLGLRVDEVLSLHEYSVTVDDIPCTIVGLADNVITFNPPDISSLKDYTEKQPTVLYIGAYLSYTIGNLVYYKNWIDDPKHKNGLIGGLVGGIGGLLLLVGITILVVFLYRRSRVKAGLLGSNEDRYTRPPGEHDGPVTEYLSDDVKAQVINYTIPYERIELLRELSHGNFGKVCEGTLMDNDGVKRPVAIKSLHGAHPTIHDKVEFVQEAILMADFCHQHVLSLIAIVIEENVPYVVLPLMELGDLRAYVLNDGNSLNLGNLVKFSLEVAEGMEYLASRRFVHRDLAARNCMINNDMLVKVADFGLARDIFEKDYYRPKDTQRPLPFKWMAIECLSNNTEFTEKSDVWSYGVLVWELMTRGKRPYMDVDNLDLKRFLMQGRRLEKPPVAPGFIYNLMLRCWLPDRKDRPRFKDIVVELKEILMSAEESNAAAHAAGEMNVAFDDGRVSYLQLSGNQRQ